MHQLRLSERKELIVDNFAGGGGASLGMEAALGRPVDIAINHDEEALAIHLANHPDTLHLCESIWDVDPLVVTKGCPVGLAWFSPDCRHFSKAKGGKPVEKNVRGLAWVVLRWAARGKPRVIILENVEEFQSWGPLTRSSRPCPQRKGETYQAWWSQLESMGYRVDSRQLRACDYGSPTIRKRLFVVARRDGLPIVWPEASHGEGLTPFRTAAEIIDWSLPCPSIFDRKRPLVENTMRRIARGIQRYVIEAEEPFIVRTGHYSNITGEGSHFRGQSTSKPLSTVTAGGNDKAVVVPYLSQYNGQSIGQETNSPAPTGTSRPKAALVVPLLTRNNPGNPPRTAQQPLGTVTTSHNRHALVAAFLAQHNGGATGRAAKAAMATATGRSTQIQAVISHLIKLRGTSRVGRPVTEPAATITAGGTHLGEVRAFLLKYYGTATAADCRDPLHSLTSRARFGLVLIHGEVWQITDIGMRMLTPRELFRAQGFPESYIIDPHVDGRPLPKGRQIHMVGNSVCPQVAEAVVRANYEEDTSFGKATA